MNEVKTREVQKHVVDLGNGYKKVSRWYVDSCGQSTLVDPQDPTKGIIIEKLHAMEFVTSPYGEVINGVRRNWEKIKGEYVGIRVSHVEREEKPFLVCERTGRELYNWKLPYKEEYKDCELKENGFYYFKG